MPKRCLCVNLIVTTAYSASSNEAGNPYLVGVVGVRKSTAIGTVKLDNVKI
jgi:hypothetical protein